MKILIVCTGNTCRSPMAEGIFNQLKTEAGLDLQVLSAGISAQEGSQISENAIDAMASFHDISHYRSRLVDEDLVNQADLILTMTAFHKDMLISRYEGIENKIFLLNEYAYGLEVDIEDPYGLSTDMYKQVRDKIYKAVEKIIDKLAGDF